LKNNSTTCQPERVEEDDGHDHLAGHDREGIVEVVARHNLSKKAFQINFENQPQVEVFLM
jgi:hypothetical protein